MEPSPIPEALRDLVVIGASAGGVETLRRVVADLPADLPAAVCVVVHIAPASPSALAHILSRAGPLPCQTAEDGEPLRPGIILVAPPDRHLEIEDGRVRLTVGPRENGHRPAVDALFRSAAAAFDGRVLGVVLSGTRDDGTAGLAAIKSAGGNAIVQDPHEALYAGMPAHALANVSVDAVVRSDLVASTVAAMVKGHELPDNVHAHDPVADPYDDEGAIPMICPDCGGVLREHFEDEITQWECRVGHRYSPTSLIDAQADGVEEALWAAIRVLEDRRILLDQIADQMEEREQHYTAARFRRRANDAQAQAELVRDALVRAAQTTLRKLDDSEHAGAQGNDGS